MDLTTNPVSIKEAALTAGKFISDLLPDAIDLRLEEVNVEGEVWKIVMSFNSRSAVTAGFQALLGAGTNRIYKLVTVDRISGEAQSMHIWKP